jgi:vacuolar-type H+-ATPase subunit I/STV1
MDGKDETGFRKDKRNDQNRSAAMESAGSESTLAGDEQDRANYSSGTRGNHQREDFDQPDPERNIGKILSQLREIEQSHLAYVGAHKKRLETRLNDAEEHERKFISQVEAVEQQIRDLMESL